MKITNENLAMALCQLSLMKYFPSEPMQQKGLAVFLQRLCGHREGLEWLVQNLVNHVSEWPGPAEVRGIYCTRFKPADGIENFNCTLPGFTPEDGEMASATRDVAALPQGEARGLLESIAPGGKLAIRSLK